MTAIDRPIAERYPALAEDAALLALADLPTPVEELAGIGRLLGRDGLWVKRDDVSSELYGGNKVRKLEFLLGRARRAGASTIVTVGGCGSNHLLATALHGRGNGFRTVGVVFDQPLTDAVRRNMAAHRGAGVELIRSGSKYLLPAVLAWTLARLRLREDRPPHFVPGGGSSPLGTLGFVNAGLELACQVRAGALPEPRAVFLPYGTGGTAVGLALGLQVAGLSTRVIAVRVIDRLLANRPRLEMLARAVCRLIHSHQPTAVLPGRPAANLEIRQGYIGTGYGHPTAEAVGAVAAFREHEDLRLEFTYTGKAAAAFMHEARRTSGPLLFWNTHSSADISRWVEAGEAEVPSR